MVNFGHKMEKDPNDSKYNCKHEKSAADGNRCSFI